MNITCIPAGDRMLLDCDQCGPLGTIPINDTHIVCTGHLAWHGINTDQITVCGCGYDWAHTTGHPQDVATCTTCGWWAHGLFADHHAHHHHQTTGHTWTLGRR